MTNESVSAGPALSCAAIPVSTKMPVPMMQPTPKLVSSIGPSTRRSRFSPDISSSSSDNGLVAKRYFIVHSLSEQAANVHEKTGKLPRFGVHSPSWMASKKYIVVEGPIGVG